MFLFENFDLYSRAWITFIKYIGDDFCMEKESGIGNRNEQEDKREWLNLRIILIMFINTQHID